MNPYHNEITEARTRFGEIVTVIYVEFPMIFGYIDATSVRDFLHCRNLYVDCKSLYEILKPSQNQ